MGLTSGSTGIHAVDTGLVVKKQRESDLVVALAGNPNVGKSCLLYTSDVYKRQVSSSLDGQKERRRGPKCPQRLCCL